jgi:alpha-glucuronidase
MRKQFRVLGLTASVWLLLLAKVCFADDGYKLWLNYARINDRAVAAQYMQQLKQVYFAEGLNNNIVARVELMKGMADMLQLKPQIAKSGNAGLLIGTLKTLPAGVTKTLPALTNDDGYLIKTINTNNRKQVVIAGKTQTGVLYGVFNFLKLMQTQQPVGALNVNEYPRLERRILDHWDNLNRTVERGYAGASIWNWHKLPGYIEQQYIDYARANASIGINGTVLNNVNANALMLTPEYLVKVKALADAFRPYGIRVYLSVKFSSPIEVGKIKTADPLNTEVRQWWKDKVDEIYKYVPDFGGFLVKANSEGQPGPQAYGRNHADGANMMAEALAPHNGIVMWRAFVYDSNPLNDRAKQAYDEFKPLDGKFADNVIVQVKNGAIDFQPREPFHPLFGAMPKTPLMMEFQITQEYTGFSTHLFYEAPLFKEILDADTYAAGKGTTVAKVLETKPHAKAVTGIAGVANIGADRNWCGHPFAQSNWYAFGRLAWNPNQSSAQIADDWLRMTFNNDKSFVQPMVRQMLQSRENTVNYMTPLGLHHIMGINTHYGPGPWVSKAERPDWTAVYYHKADSLGIGFDRSSTGSKATSQYAPQVQQMFDNPSTCPDSNLLWFHHLSWNYKMRSGKTLWFELVHHYYEGVDSVRRLQTVWNGMQGKVDQEQFVAVKQLIAVQLEEAIRWRDACVLYFQTFSKQPIPPGYEKPAHPLSYYRDQQFHFAPGIGGNI